ncbi:MAG: NUDIX hydrolase [Cytophagaceae bacterium]
MKRKGKILFYRKHQKKIFILLGQRSSKEGEVFWWIPGGGVEGDETFFQGAVRELYEELVPTESMEIAVNLYHTGEPEYIGYKTSFSENRIFFIPLQDATVPEIKDEFDLLKWFASDELPENMSSQFYKIKDQVFNKLRLV